MKKSTLCSSVALACAFAFALSGCSGSDDGQLQIPVTLSGVTKTGLTISNRGGTPVAVEPGTLYVFPDLVPVDSDYDVAIVTKPANTDSCIVVNGKGNTGAYSPSNIYISCVVTTYTLGGTVSGLNGDNLTVNNGAQSVKIAKGATTFSMTTPTTALPKLGEVPEGKPYGLTILQQPSSGTCTIANPNGIMPAGPVNNIVISCTP
jgi:hypothetical protein